jgi:hypothetical protein
VRLILVLCLLPLALGPAGRGAAADPLLLVGTVGPGYTIDLADAQGKRVDVLTAGTYRLLVHDLSDIHNFALGSKTANVRLMETGIEFVGDETFTLDLPPGLYAYACSAHWQTMNGQFRVVAPPPPPPPAATPKRLSAKVTDAAVSMSKRRVAAGSYRLVVSDRSRARDFHLVGPGVNRRTGKAFTGSVTWRLDLGAGTYRFGSDPRLTGRLAVAAG